VNTYGQLVEAYPWATKVNPVSSSRKCFGQAKSNGWMVLNLTSSMLTSSRMLLIISCREGGVYAELRKQRVSGHPACEERNTPIFKLEDSHSQEKLAFIVNIFFLDG
jgi:hypothetical protein